ncbi:unnamed protein product [Soboliphyme baturini]|uniref:Fibronectin type-III domain-containing protein n=1 Tax=Soboliphyme baturini TaxID=241478 RepID=A0A183J3M7_9BILA|nr:unnamed protein product [Soboliphyme baturini]
MSKLCTTFKLKFEFEQLAKESEFDFRVKAFSAAAGSGRSACSAHRLGTEKSASLWFAWKNFLTSQSVATGTVGLRTRHVAFLEATHPLEVAPVFTLHGRLSRKLPPNDRCILPLIDAANAADLGDLGHLGDNTAFNIAYPDSLC